MIGADVFRRVLERLPQRLGRRVVRRAESFGGDLIGLGMVKALGIAFYGIKAVFPDVTENLFRRRGDLGIGFRRALPHGGQHLRRFGSRYDFQQHGFPPQFRASIP